MKNLLKIVLLLIFVSINAQNRRGIINKIHSRGSANNNTYYFNPSTSGIVEGIVSDAVALNNTTIINNELSNAVTAGNNIFEVPTMDVYFNTGGNGNSREETASMAIQIPDGMHFKMSPLTVLRRQPSSVHSSALLTAIYKADETRLGENIEISGGTLVGDINDHTYLVGFTITSPATTTNASIKIQREYVPTIYEIPVTVSDVLTNASEIASYINTNLTDMVATLDGATINITPDPGIYVLIDDDATDISNIEIARTAKYTHEYGFGISFYGVHDSYIHDVYIKDFHGDGIFLDKTNLRNIDGTLRSNLRTCENILIQRVTTENCRRQGISVVDCNGYEKNVALPTPGGIGSRVGVIIDDCDITDTGRDSYHLPAFGIDLECYRETGEEYARVENVIIKNSRFTGNRKGDINLFNSQHVQIFNNDFTYKIGHVASHSVSVHDNTFTYVDTYPINFANSYAIALNRYLETDFVHDFDLYNNVISGYTFGIIAGGDRFNVYGNTITNLNPNGGVALRLGDLTDSSFHDNSVNISGPDVFGYETWVLGNNIESLNIYNETIVAGENGTGIRLRDVISSGTGINISNSSFSGGLRDVEVINSTNIEFINCTYSIVNQSGNTNVTIP